MAITRDFLKEELNKVNSEFAIPTSGSGAYSPYTSKYEDLFKPVSSDFVNSLTTPRKPLSTGTYSQSSDYVPTTSQYATEKEPSGFVKSVAGLYQNITGKQNPTFWDMVVAPIKMAGSAIASGTVNTVRTVGGTIERQYNSRMRDQEQPLYRNFEKAVSDIFSGEDIKGGLNDLAQILPAPFSYGIDAGKNISEVIKGDKTVSEGLQGLNMVSDVKAMFSPQKSAMDVLLQPIEDDVRAWAGYNDMGAIGQTIYGGLESTPVSALASAGGVGYYFMYLSSLRNSLESLWAEEKATGIKYKQSELLTYAIGSAGLDVGLELMFPVVGKVGSKLAKSTGIVGMGIKKLFGFITKKAGKEAVSGIAETAVKKVVKPTLLKTLLRIQKVSAQEGLEEIITQFSTGILAKTTIDKEKKWLGTDGNAILDSQALALAFLGGYVGGHFAATGESIVTHKNRVREWISQNQDLPQEELSTPEKQAEVDALINGVLEDDAVQDEITQESIDVMNAVANDPEIYESEAIAELKDYAINSPVEMPTLLVPPQGATGVPIAVDAQSNITSLPQEQGDTEGASTVVETPIKKSISYGSLTMSEIADRRTEIDSLERELEYAKRTQQQQPTDAGLVSYEKLKKENGLAIRRLRAEIKTSLEPVAVDDIQRKIDALTIKKNKSTIGTERRIIAKEIERLSIKLSNTKPTTQPQAVSQAEAKSSVNVLANMPDAGSGDRQGIVAKGFETQARSDEKYVVDGIDEDVVASMKRTSNFEKNNASLKEVVQDAYNYVRKNVMLGSVTVSDKFGDFKRAIRNFREAGNKATARVVEVIRKSYGAVKGKQRDLFKKALIFYDFEENIKRGIPFVPGRHGVKTVDQLYRITDALRAEIAKPENKAVRDAYDNRKKLMDSALDELIALGDKVGKNYRYMKERQYYVYNKIYEQYVAANSNINKQGIKFYQRKGSANDYVSNPIILDFLSMTKIYKMIGRLDVLAEVIALDKSKDVKYDKVTGKEILPEGYIRVNKNEIVGNLEITNDVEKKAHETALEVMRMDGIATDSIVGKKILKKANFLDYKSSIVIPIEIYDNVVDEFTKKESARFSKAEKKLVSLWKWTKIRSPFVVIKYNTRNMVGDLEFAITVMPSVVTKAPKAISDLIGFFYKNQRDNELVMNHMDKTGAMTGISVREMGDVEPKIDLDALSGDLTGKQKAKIIAKKAWGVLTAKKFTKFREQILRYAAYLKLTEQSIAKLKTIGIDVVPTSKYDAMVKAKQPLVSSSGNKIISFSDYLNLEDSVFKDGYKPKSYLTSSRDEINSIKKLDDKNVKLSEDMLGAYNDVSPFGVWTADHAMPFFRFQEVSVKRYVRLVENTYYSEGATVNNRGKSISQKAGVAARIGAVGTLKLGKYAIRLALFYAAITACNSLFAGDDEDKLPEDVKNQPHITIPSWIFGDKARVYYISNLGIASSFLYNMGIQFGTQDVLDVMTGKKTLEDVAKEMAKPNMASIVFGINPLMIQAVELASGKKGYYFDPENPSQIRDKAEYVFQQAGFGQMYTILAGKPGNVSTVWGSALANNAATGDVAMWAVYDMEDEYRKENNIDPKPSVTYDRNSDKWKKANAAYYYKLGIKLGDTNAIKKYMAEYVALGGTADTMDKSLQTMMPLQFMSKVDREGLISQMTEAERETYDRAVKWYEEIRAVDDSVFK